jgi:hypothetical protein
MSGGLTHFPSGAAEVFVTTDDRLFLTNLGASGRDGFCTILPNWNGVVVTEPTPIRLLRNEQLTLTFASQDERLLSVGVRQRPGPGMRGFMDYTDDSVMAQVDLTRNGELVASEVGVPSAIDLPEMDLVGWSFHGLTGTFSLHGLDKSVPWVLTVTPLSFAGGPLRRSALTLATTIPGRTLTDGLFGGAE